MSFDFVKAALKNGRLSHSLLFLGSDLEGARSAAEELAKILLCEKNPTDKACGACVSCREVAGRIHPDLLWTAPDERDTIKIESVRELIARSGFRPLRSRKKVFVIERAERMNEAAQSALLKTLEEPEPSSVIILIAGSAETILPTIRSRVQALRFEKAGAARSSDDPGVLHQKEEALDYLLSRREKNGSSRAPFLPPDFSREERLSVAAVMEELVASFRDALVFSEGASACLFGKEDAQRKRILSAYSTDEILDRLELLSQAKERLLANVNQRLVLAEFWSGMDAR